MTNTILIVDDARLLTPDLLKDLKQDFKVVMSPSAEQGLLELRLASFGLLLTTVHLLGMDGFELVGQAKRLYPNLPVLMMADSFSVDEQKRGEALGVQGYFSNPLDQDALITAVSTHLSSSTEPKSSEPESSPVLPLAMIRNRLTSLRNDTGASSVMFARISGELLVEEADSTNSYQSAQVVEWLQKMVVHSLLLADSVASETSFSLQYQVLDDGKLYSANVGRNYFVVLGFAAESRAGGISSVSVFTRRAIKDLLVLLDEHVAGERLVETSELVAQREDDIEPARGDGQQAGVVETDSMLEAPTLEPPIAEPLTEAEMEQLLALDFSTTVDDSDLNAFWTEAAAEEVETTSKGLSWEEAKKRGLLSDLAND